MKSIKNINKRNSIILNEKNDMPERLATAGIDLDAL